MHKTFTVSLIFFFLFITATLTAQRFEAEDATLTGGATQEACSTCSGGYFVAMRNGSLAFDIALEEEGFYNIYVHAAAPDGEKTNIFNLNGNTLDFVLERNSNYETILLVSNIRLEGGEHEVQIQNSWGYINIDYLEFEAVEASDRFNLRQTLVNPTPIPEAVALYDFLLDNYGKKIISGAMTLNDIASSPWIDWLEENTGKEPALMGMDFMHSGRNYNWYDDRAPTNDARNYYQRNGIPTIMWHWRDPSKNTEEFYTEGTNFNINDIFDPASPGYEAMIADIDYIAEMLLEIQEDGVPVIWRPLHEAAGGWFWWGAQGPEPLKALWQIMYERMVDHHQLNNLIWVWTREPNDDAWYPGDDYVDIVARDIYRDGDHSSHALEFNDMNNLYQGRKMLTLGEVGSIPDPDNLERDGVAWSWFMPWYNEYTTDPQYNSVALWQKTMNHDYVITLDEMPDLRSYERQDEVEEVEEEEEEVITSITEQLHAGFKAYPVPVKNELLIMNDDVIITEIILYNTLGTLLQTIHAGEHSVSIPFGHLGSGIYFLKINGDKMMKVFKE